MKLQGETGGSFELAVVQYESPDFTEDLWEANWLVVKGTVAAPEGSWQFIDPCVTTFELAKLADWLDSAATTGFDSSECTFVEPNLALWCSNLPRPLIEICFAHESAPPWLSDADARIAGLRVNLRVSAEAVRQAAVELRAILEGFPIRGGAA